MPDPVSLNISTGNSATYRCQHPTADNITWKLNDELVRREAFQYVTTGTVDDEGGTVNTVTIVGHLVGVYEVVCVASFSDGSPDVTSTPVTLNGISVSGLYIKY